MCNFNFYSIIEILSELFSIEMGEFYLNKIYLIQTKH